MLVVVAKIKDRRSLRAGVKPTFDAAYRGGRLLLALLHLGEYVSQVRQTGRSEITSSPHYLIAAKTAYTPVKSLKNAWTIKLHN
jgi:hypothetical protein